MAHDNDYQLDELVEITFEGMPYWIMPRYVHHYVHNSYEKFSLKLIRNLIKEGDTFLDIGAHYGAYSIYAAEKCRAKVIAMEPVNENFEIFSKNIGANHLEPLIETHNAAASNEDGEAEFNIPWASDSAGFYEHPLAETYKKQKVTVLNVDGMIGKRRVDFIKIDTEGHELTVLSGLKQTLARNPNVKLLIEANPSCLESGGRSIEELLTYLADDLNKELYVVDEDSFTLKRISGDIANWAKYVDGYANILCFPKKGSQYALFVCHSNELGGGELAMLEAVTVLREKNIQSHVVVPYGGPLRDRLVEAGISHSIITYGYWLKAADDEQAVSENQKNIEAAGQIARLAADINPTVVCNNTLVCPWGLLAARQLQLPLVWFVHEFGDKDHGMQFSYPIETIRKFVSLQADVVICSSKAVAADFKGAQNVAVQYPTLHSENIVSLAEQEAEQVFKHKKSLKLCLVGRIQKSKGQLTAVQALAKLSNKGINAELVLMGSGEAQYLKKIKAEIRRLELTDQITIMKFVDNPYPIMAQADVILVCSDNEAFGRVTVEGMLLGKPVVGAASGGTKELITDGKDGLLFEPGNADDLAAKILMLKGSALWTKLAAHASASVQKQIHEKGTPDLLHALFTHLDYTADRFTKSLLAKELGDALYQNVNDRINLRAEVQNNVAVRERLEQRLAYLTDYAENLTEYAEKLTADRDAILQSASWKITRPARYVLHNGRRAYHLPQKIREKQQTEAASKAYEDIKRRLERSGRRKNVNTAVILHLYYAEAWPAFRKHLQFLASVTDFDLYVTVPVLDRVPDDLHDSFKSVTILEVPNRGRDILPFMMLAPVLAGKGYEYFLKLHSKRSLHFNGGSDWFSSLLNSLLPEDTDIIRSTITKLGDKQTGVVCPANQYVSLLVNYRSNRRHINGIIADATSLEMQRKVHSAPHNYGFAAGTMFWARFDALKPLFDKGYAVPNFEMENGQIDGTFAHALERAFTVVPELLGKSVYVVGQTGIKRTEYDSGAIPEWSDIKHAK